MNDKFRVWVAVGAVFGLVAVAAAAGGAHLAVDPAPARALASAVQMNGWHALALLFCGVWARGRLTHAAGAAFTAGTVLFCGSVYAGVLGVAVGPVAPVGGVLLMGGWALLAASALRR